jgi:DNA (cytosine-5)-methyltransferase 1
MNKPKLTMIELFSGIGAQKRGIDNTNLYDLNVIATSDIDKEAVVEYAAIHHGLTKEMIENYTDYPSREEMVEDLKSRNIGMDFDKGKMYDWDKLIKKKTKDIEKYWLAMKLQNNLGDISKIEQLPTADCWFYSFCCQDISIAGKQKGLKSTCEDCGCEFNPMELPVEDRDTCPNCGSKNIKGTRSGLLKEVERLLARAVETNTQPKYLCLENVKNLVGKQFKPDFDVWMERLEELGYNTYWKVLNAKECGIPQNRERVFAFSIRKDIDTGKFTFPLPFDTGLRLKDILEKEVDEKYYINTERAANLIKQLVDKGQLKGQRECADCSINDPNTRDVSNCIVARYDKGISNQKQEGLVVAEPQDVNVSGILVKNQGTEYVKPLDESVTLKARDWKGWDNYGSTAVVEETKLDSSKRLGGLWDGKTTHQAGSVWDTNGMSPTLDTAQGGGRMPHIVEESNEKTKPTPIWRQLGSTQYKVNNFGTVADTKNKCKVEPFEEDGEMKVKLNINGVERVTTISKLLDKLFPNNPICVENTTPSGKSQCNAVYSIDGVSQTLCAGTHGYATGSILEEKDKLNNIISKNISEDESKTIVGIKQATKKGYIECEVPGLADFSFPNSTKRRGRVQDGGQTCPTLTAAEGGIRYIESLYRIRKLTPRECFRLMGFTFEDWDKCEAIGISNSAGYKAAGNSIVTNCISLLFEHLYKAQYDESYICTDENFQNPQVD